MKITKEININYSNPDWQNIMAMMDKIENGIDILQANYSITNGLQKIINEENKILHIRSKVIKYLLEDEDKEKIIFSSHNIHKYPKDEPKILPYTVDILGSVIHIEIQNYTGEIEKKFNLDQALLNKYAIITYDFEPYEVF